MGGFWQPTFQTHKPSHYHSPIIWGSIFEDTGFTTFPSGKHSHNYGKSQFLIGKSTISMAIFNSKLLVYQRVYH